MSAINCLIRKSGLRLVCVRLPALRSCRQRTIETDLPRQIAWLRAHDAAMRQIMDRVEIPDRLAQDFIMFVRQNDGQLPKARRTGVFAELTDTEVASLEDAVRDAFEAYMAAGFE